MKKELLPPDILTTQLKERLTLLKKCLKHKLNSQKSAPQGHLRISMNKNRGSPQFYFLKELKDHNGTYLPVTQMDKIKKLAQNDYDAKLIKLLQNQIKKLEEYISLSDGKIEQLYGNLNKTRQTLITPATLTNEQYTEEWQNVTWHGHPFSEDTPEYTTARNERVRSKSEVIIADTLNRTGIPYRYEYPLELNNRTYHPDFLCLNLRTRQEFIWEHFGMMDTKEYLENAIGKIKAYNENNFFVGKNLIITMETSTIPINTHQIEQMIEAYLM